MIIRNVQLVKRPLLLVSLAIGTVVVAIKSRTSRHDVPVLKLGSLFSSSMAAQSASALYVTPHVTESGKTDSYGSGGTADITMTAPGSDTAHVEASGGHKKIATDVSHGGASSRTGVADGIDVPVSSNSNGGALVYGFRNSSTTNRSSSSFSRTLVFSTGSNNVIATSS